MPYKSAGPRQRKLQLWISDSLFERVRERADEEGDTLSEVVRRLLSIYAAEGDQGRLAILTDQLNKAIDRLAVLEDVS